MFNYSGKKQLYTDTIILDNNQERLSSSITSCNSLERPTLTIYYSFYLAILLTQALRPQYAAILQVTPPLSPPSCRALHYPTPPYHQDKESRNRISATGMSSSCTIRSLLGSPGNSHNTLVCTGVGLIYHPTVTCEMNRQIHGNTACNYKYQFLVPYRTRGRVRVGLDLTPTQRRTSLVDHGERMDWNSEALNTCDCKARNVVSDDGLSTQQSQTVSLISVQNNELIVLTHIHDKLLHTQHR